MLFRTLALQTCFALGATHMEMIYAIPDNILTRPQVLENNQIRGWLLSRRAMITLPV